MWAELHQDPEFPSFCIGIGNLALAVSALTDNRPIENKHPEYTSRFSEREKRFVNQMHNGVFTAFALALFFHGKGDKSTRRVYNRLMKRLSAFPSILRDTCGKEEGLGTHTTYRLPERCSVCEIVDLCTHDCSHCCRLLCPQCECNRPDCMAADQAELLKKQAELLEKQQADQAELLKKQAELDLEQAELDLEQAELLKKQAELDLAEKNHGQGVKPGPEQTAKRVKPEPEQVKAEVEPVEPPAKRVKVEDMKPTAKPWNSMCSNTSDTAIVLD